MLAKLAPLPKCGNVAEATITAATSTAVATRDCTCEMKRSRRSAPVVVAPGVVVALMRGSAGRPAPR